MRLDIALRDLDVALDLDTDSDGKLTWREVKSSMGRIQSYAQSNVFIPGCKLRSTGTLLERRNDGAYVALNFESTCHFDPSAPIGYSLFADVDPTHRGLAKVLLDGQEPRLIVLTPTAFNSSEPLSDGRAAGAEQKWGAVERGQFLREGIHHILSGYDHILFLVCLLLPAVMRREQSGWQSVGSIRLALVPVLGIVFAFTLAHSLTLAVSALHLVEVSSAIVEPAIALTIMLAALDNLYPILPTRRAVAAFVFGLVHGFGFATVLSELDLPAMQFAFALVEFNVGLELGQTLIVVTAVGLLYPLRRWKLYPFVILKAGSTAAVCIATLWMVERLLDVSILPFKV